MALSDVDLLALCVWREARGGVYDEKRGVAHVIRNRVAKGGWWGDTIPGVILKPFQFSSFNANDVNANLWPQDSDTSWIDARAVAYTVNANADEDLTDGATYYHDLSVGFPKAWGWPSAYINTINIGRLNFYRPRPPESATDEGELDT